MSDTNCICLERIGDNGLCPEHGEPYASVAASGFVSAARSIIVIYTGEDACQKCLGWKRVDDGEGQSWKYWAELPAQSAIAVKMGLVKPIECPRCKGTGIDPESQSQEGE